MNRLVHVAVATTIASLALLGCSGSPTDDDPPAIRAAKAAYRQTVESNPEYAVYGLSMASDASSGTVRSFVLESIGSAHYPTALEAVKAVSEDPPPEAEQPLREVYAAKGGALKLLAAVALARLGDEPALEWLRGKVKENVMFNASAVRLLAERGESEFLAPLFKKAMASDDLATRDQVYATLGELRQPWATALLLEGLDREFGEDRRGAIAGLGMSNDPSVAAKVAPFINTKGLVFASIEALGALGSDKASRSLRKLAGHDQALVRAHAGVALWRIGEQDKAIEALTPLTTNEDPGPRRVLAEQLGRVSSPEATAMLAGLALDGDPTVQIAALRALIGRRGVAAEQAFLAVIETGEYEAQVLALNGLARAGTGAALPALEPLVGSDNPYIALAAAHTVLAIHEREPASAAAAGSS